jgi:hypothetical protein
MKTNNLMRVKIQNKLKIDEIDEVGKIQEIDEILNLPNLPNLLSPPRVHRTYL